METRLGQAAPLVVAMEAILAACPLVADMEVVAEGPCVGLWLLVMPRWSLSLQASPGGLLVPVGCPVLSVWPRRAFLFCLVLFCVSSPGGLLIPPNFPREIWWGGSKSSGCRGQAEGTEAKGPRPRPRRPSAMASRAPYTAMASRAPYTAMASRAPSSTMASWAPCTAMASRAPSSAMVPVCLFHSGGPRPVFLSVFVLRGLQSARPPPLPDGTVKAWDEPFGRGELCQGSVVCHVFPPLVSIFGLFPVLVSCHYELSMFQLCLSHYVLITLCILVLSFEFDVVWSTRYFPGVFLSMSPALMFQLKTIIWVYVLVCLSCSSLVCAPWQ